jgi:pimeloyl-ACP methyl ester carboxylesterase
MQDSRQDGTVAVSGDRSLSYRGYGPPDGKPVLFFPGTPGSTAEWSIWPSGSAELSGIRVIAVDRPGLGWSDWQPGRRVLDWPVDVTALADALGLQRFAVLGYSSGVPYALACGQLLPDRVTAVTLVGSVGPDDEPGLVAGLSPQVARMRQDSRRHPRRAWLTWAGVRVALARYRNEY